MFVINCLSTLIYDNNYYPLISAKHATLSMLTEFATCF